MGRRLRSVLGAVLAINAQTHSVIDIGAWAAAH